MVATTNVPKPTFGPLGFQAPIEADVLAGRQLDIDQAFGGGTNPALTTPQGQLASSDAAIIGNTNDEFCDLTHQMDPAFASGRMQDGIGRIYFIERKPALPTIVQALCTGLAGLPIPAGSLAQALDGNVYTSTQDGEIGINGTVTIPFACNTVGPVACPEGALDEIYRAIPGWDTITNLDEGVIGRNVESRQEFENRRAESTGKNSSGAASSIRGEVLGVSSVLDAYVITNDTNAPKVIGEVTLIPNSLYVAAVGGTDADVAQAIWKKKAPGCSYNGNTTVTVYDTNSGYDPPYPSYVVKFQRPAALPVLFAVNLQLSAQVPSDALTQIQTAIIAAFAGADGGARARIGGVVYGTRYNAPVAALGAWAQIISLQVGSANTAISEFTGSISGNTLTVTAIGDPDLAVGQTIIASGVADGTKISAFGSGTGGAGTYTLSGTPQTVASTTLAAVLPDQNKVAVEIDQVPTISAGNIALILTP